jgi:hippurate hydrolase
VINSAEMTALSRQGAALAVGQDNVLPLRTANMGGEDFSYYLEKVPGAYIRFGSQVPGLESFPAHSSKFDFDEQALAVGASYFHRMAIVGGQHLLNQPHQAEV